MFAFDIALRPGRAEHSRRRPRWTRLSSTQLRTEPVRARELEKAKNQTKANFVYAADGVTKLAQQIGYYNAIDGPATSTTFPAKVDAVTAEDIRNVVRKYFARENRTVGWLVATGGGGHRRPRAGAGDGAALQAGGAQ